MTDNTPEQYGFIRARVVGIGGGSYLVGQDAHPDLKAADVRLELRPSVPLQYVQNAEPTTLVQDTLIARLDSDGYLIDPAGNRGAWLPIGAYTVVVRHLGETLTTFPIELSTANTEAHPLDLSDYTPFPTPTPSEPYMTEALYREVLANAAAAALSAEQAEVAAASAGGAADSATEADAARNAAQTSESNAAVSEASATSFAAQANASATSAATSAASANSARTAAQGSAQNANTSETNAAYSASSATTASAAASTLAGQAASSASAAHNSETNAAASAVAAQAAADAATAGGGAPSGPSLPAGGTKGQVLRKASDADGDATFASLFNDRGTFDTYGRYQAGDYFTFNGALWLVVAPFSANGYYPWDPSVAANTRGLVPPLPASVIGRPNYALMSNSGAVGAWQAIFGAWKGGSCSISTPAGSTATGTISLYSSFGNIQVFQLASIGGSYPLRIRGYRTDADRTADMARPAGTPSPAVNGAVFDITLTAAGTYWLTPSPLFFDELGLFRNPVDTTNIYISVSNPGSDATTNTVVLYTAPQ